MSFKKIDLYGGAITVDLPAAYGDVSQIREVPDHQEVFLDEGSYSGVIFEILEYVDKPTDEEALQYHFADLVDGTDDATNMLSQARASVKTLPNTPLYTLHFIQTPPAPTRPNQKVPEYTSINLLLVRLKKQKTDLLITINAPHYPGEYEKAAEGEPTPLMKEGEAIKSKVLESFEIKEWGLFEG